MGDSQAAFTIANSTGAVWMALMLHFAAGLAGLVSGFIAVVARKGGYWHRHSGNVFVVAMVILGATAIGVAAAEGNIGSMLGGGITVYFVLTAFMTLRPVGGSHRSGWVVALMAIAFTVASTQLYFGVVALGRPRMMLNGVPGPMIPLPRYNFVTRGGGRSAAVPCWRHHRQSPHCTSSLAHVLRPVHRLRFVLLRTDELST